MLNLIDTPGPRRLHLRGLAQPRRLRGRDPGGGRLAGHRGADAVQLLPGASSSGLTHRAGASTRSTCRRRGPTRSALEIDAPDRRAEPRTIVRASAPRPASACAELLERVVARRAAAGGRPATRRCGRSSSTRSSTTTAAWWPTCASCDGPRARRATRSASCRPASSYEVDGGRASSAEARSPPTELDAGRGRLHRRRHQDGGRRARRRHGHARGRRGDRSRCRATATSSRWCSAGSTRSTPSSTRSCKDALDKLSSTTPRWSTSPRPRWRWASASAAASSACCTWRSCRSGCEREYSIDLIATMPERGVPRAAHRTASVLKVDNPAQLPPADEHRDRSRSRSCARTSSRPPSTSATS